MQSPVEFCYTTSIYTLASYLLHVFCHLLTHNTDTYMTKKTDEIVEITDESQIVSQTDDSSEVRLC